MLSFFSKRLVDPKSKEKDPKLVPQEKDPKSKQKDPKLVPKEKDRVPKSTLNMIGPSKTRTHGIM